MPNDFGALTSSIMVHNIVDDLVAQIKAILRLARNFSERTENGVVLRRAAPGSTVKVEDWNLRGTGIPDVYNVDPVDGYTAGAITRKPQRTFTLPSTIKAISIAITPAEYRMLTADNIQGIDGYSEFNKRVREAIIDKFALAFVTRFLEIISDHTFYTFETEIATFTREVELELETKLFKRKLASKNNATCILDPDSFLEYRKDHLTIQNNTGAGLVNVMSDVQQSLNTSFGMARTHATLPNKIEKGFAYCEPAAFFVARIPDEPSFENDPVSLQEVVHPDCELPMLFRLWKDPKTGIMQFDVATIFEFFKNQAEAVERFIAD